MNATEVLNLYGESVKTALGFFWKSGWAFVLGYFVSGMIQAFVPKSKMTRYMGDADFRTVSLSTIFGAASSSCSFAALATAKSLVKKGAHFVAAVAFMFASTNLVIELGILILIFLGWQYLAAEVVGGLVLIFISTIIIKLTYPEKWMKQAREKLEDEEGEEESFDWRKRIKSRYGWHLVGQKFVSDWKMAWEDILIGFTIAGFVAVLVPNSFWSTLFMSGMKGDMNGFLLNLENAAIAPFVAAATFIGSMGNIPLATVLAQNGVLFAGIMGFIYSDLMVPPLVHINAKYYGWKVALYIAGVMFVSIVITALSLDYGFQWFGLIPESHKEIEHLTQFAVDYTFWLNIAFVFVTGWLIYLYREHVRQHLGGQPMQMDMEGGGPIKSFAVYTFISIDAAGLLIYVWMNLL